MPAQDLYQVGQILYLKTAPIFAWQEGEKWLRITNSPSSSNTPRPFVFLRHDSEIVFSYVVPISSRNRSGYTVDVPSGCGLETGSAIIYTQVWEIRNEWVTQAISNNVAHSIPESFMLSTVLPRCKPYLDKLTQ